MGIVLNPIDHKCHSLEEGKFREQIAVLYYTGLWSDGNSSWAKFIKSFHAPCQPGSASLDPANPGADTFDAWKVMDKLIEENNVRGFYHTHPYTAPNFSGQDYRLQEGLARANGDLFIWHVVQAAGSSSAEVVCLNMINGQVFMHKLGNIEHNPADPVILLPLPVGIHKQGKMLVLDLSGGE